MKARQVQRRLHGLADARAAASARRFFKAVPGQPEDTFLGITAPSLRAFARTVLDLPLAEIDVLFQSAVHEERSLALLLLIGQFAKGDAAQRQQLHEFYLARTGRVNNWDLVDLSAGPLVGAHLDGSDRSLLDRLAGSASLWERRIAIVATHHFIRQRQFADTFRIAKLLLADTEDLIHKAIGWMLREVGKRDQAALERFLKQHLRKMPRTALRYAIERFPEPLRQRYLRGDPP
jgi:3-methyladenine DNA glycosylase AlkD